MLGRAEPHAEHQRRDQGGHPETAGDGRLHDEQRQRVQRHERGDETDRIEREPADVLGLPGETREQHHVEMRGPIGAAGAGRLEHGSRAVAHRRGERADQGDEHLRHEPMTGGWARRLA